MRRRDLLARSPACAKDDAASFVASAKRYIAKARIQGRDHRGQERAAAGAGQRRGAPAARHVAARNGRSRRRGNRGAQGDRAEVPPTTRHTRCSRARSVAQGEFKKLTGEVGDTQARQPRPRAPNWKYRWRWPTSRRGMRSARKPPLKRHSRNSRRTCVRDCCASANRRTKRRFQGRAWLRRFGARDRRRATSKR